MMYYYYMFILYSVLSCKILGVQVYPHELLSAPPLYIGHPLLKATYQVQFGRLRHQINIKTPKNDDASLLMHKI